MSVKPKWKWLPPWDMPSDPVKAVIWFLHWFLQVLVRYFYVLIIVGVALETYLNGIVGLFGTLLVGLFVWALLWGVLGIVNLAFGLSKAYAEVTRLSQNPFGAFGSFGPDSTPYASREKEENVVEGSIITDLGEERRKRRQEM